MSDGPLALLALAFGLGLRHALDADHVAAVTALACPERSISRASSIGALWGLGHGSALLAVSLLVIGLRAEIPAPVARALETAVAALLVGLGLRLAWAVARGTPLHHHPHAHGGRSHSHPHLHEPATAGDPSTWHHALPRTAAASLRTGRRSPLLVGVAHGLAGSAGLMLSVLATISDRTLAALYVLCFAAGSVVGMVALGAIVVLPFHVAARSSADPSRWLRALEGAAATGSIAAGVVLFANL